MAAPPRAHRQGSQSDHAERLTQVYRGRHRPFCAGQDEADRHSSVSRLGIPGRADKAGRGPVTVRRILTLLGTIIAKAVRDELISANSAQGADKPALSDNPVKPWEPDQVRMFLARAPSTG